MPMPLGFRSVWWGSDGLRALFAQAPAPRQTSLSHGISGAIARLSTHRPSCQGATLQNYNNELVKSIEDLREKREELNRQILKEEEDKAKIQKELGDEIHGSDVGQELSILTDRLQKVNESLVRKTQAGCRAQKPPTRLVPGPQRVRQDHPEDRGPLGAVSCRYSHLRGGVYEDPGVVADPVARAEAGDSTSASPFLIFFDVRFSLGAGEPHQEQAVFGA